METMRFSSLLWKKPAIASFHFGLTEPQNISAMKEARGHRRMFDENAVDSRLSLVTLLTVIRKHVKIPVIAAGGIMDGHDICAFIWLGASTVQMGTAACPESHADSGYRETLIGHAAYPTTMTRGFPSRPARALANRFTYFTANVLAKDIPLTPLPMTQQNSS